jgi:hypothetical protein
MNVEKANRTAPSRAATRRVTSGTLVSALVVDAITAAVPASSGAIWPVPAKCLYDAGLFRRRARNHLESVSHVVIQIGYSPEFLSHKLATLAPGAQDHTDHASKSRTGHYEIEQQAVDDRECEAVRRPTHTYLKHAKQQQCRENSNISLESPVCDSAEE